MEADQNSSASGERSSIISIGSNKLSTSAALTSNQNRLEFDTQTAASATKARSALKSIENISSVASKPSLFGAPAVSSSDKPTAAPMLEAIVGRY